MVAACAVVPQMSDNKMAAPSGTTKATPSTHPPDAAASYHFMLGYQAELAQDMDRAIRDYQAALKADPASQSVKARLAGLYFSLGDMPNAVRYADLAAEGSSQDSHLLMQMAGILASAGQGERAVKLLDRAIEIDPTSGEIRLGGFSIPAQADAPLRELTRKGIADNRERLRRSREVPQKVRR